MGPHPEQGNLADFRLPQRGICVVAQGVFEPFDVARHRDAARLDAIRLIRPMTTAQNRQVTSSTPAAPPTRAEVLAALSVAIDLGLGQPAEHMLRSALIATRLADRMGLTRHSATASTTRR